MTKKRSSSRSGHSHAKAPQPAPAGAAGGTLLAGRKFWLASLVPLIVATAMTSPKLPRPFNGLHSWAQADAAWFARNHVRYGLGYTKGLATMAVGNPPPPEPKRYVNHPQLSILLNAAAMLVLGANEWSLRLVSMLLNVGILLLLLKIFRPLVGEVPALLAALLLAMFPITAYFYAGGWVVLLWLAACWCYLVLTGQIPDGPKPKLAHYLGLGACLFLMPHLTWSAFFYIAAIGVHYVARCVFRRQWPKLPVLAVLLLVPAAGAATVFLVLLGARGWNVEQLLALYKWRSAGPRAGEFHWAPWFRRAWKYALSNFTWPVLALGGGYLAYRLVCRLLTVTRLATRQERIELPLPYPLLLLFLLPGVLQLLVLRSFLLPHQFAERPLAPFVAIAAAMAVTGFGRLFAFVGRYVAVLVQAVLIVACAWACVVGAGYYYRIKWNPPQKIAMWRQLNRLVSPDRALMTFDAELDHLIVTEHKAKGAVYRGEPAWYIDRPIANAYTPQQIEKLRATGKFPCYLMPYVRSLPYGRYGREGGRKVYELHRQAANYLARTYPIIKTYPYLKPVLDEKKEEVIGFGMRPYAVFDLTRPKSVSASPVPGPAPGPPGGP
jgi:hypothetical protein